MQYKECAMENAHPMENDIKSICRPAEGSGVVDSACWLAVDQSDHAHAVLLVYVQYKYSLVS